MKKTILSFITIAAVVFSSQAQAFEKGGKYISLGLGGASYFHVVPSAGYYPTLYSPITGQLSVQGEFGVHEYVGVGFYTGIGGGAGLGGSRLGLLGAGGGVGELTVPIGVIANFHFYQLIADKSGKDIKADKLDVYAGLNLGTGLGVLFPGGGNTDLAALVWGGPQVGVRYFFKEKIAVNGELGYGKTWVNAGFTFKL